ncbi:CLUMA_CG007601, isoform A [Clunio marinus]|uniref:CLUMA_CG007601, isoform A n=1 Tax=Clunio marinus TaxID=568069 RepID=A0A1J1I588_9DIPT|nr:CLUMA_CG007601, isoform A [Clunio marinus]
MNENCNVHYFVFYICHLKIQLTTIQHIRRRVLQFFMLSTAATCCLLVCFNKPVLIYVFVSGIPTLISEILLVNVGEWDEKLCKIKAHHASGDESYGSISNLI